MATAAIAAAAADREGLMLNRLRQACRFFALGALLAWAAGGWTAPAAAAAAVAQSSGQTVVVPVYSHIFIGDRAAEFNLAATLSIRNIDPERSLSVISADYHDSGGRLLRRRERHQRRVRGQLPRALGRRNRRRAAGHRMPHDRRALRPGHLHRQSGPGRSGSPPAHGQVQGSRRRGELSGSSRSRNAPFGWEDISSTSR